MQERGKEMDSLLTVEQAAERLNVSPRFVRRLIAERRIAYCKVGRRVRITESDIAAFIAAGRVEVITVRYRNGRVVA